MTAAANDQRLMRESKSDGEGKGTTKVPRRGASFPRFLLDFLMCEERLAECREFYRQSNAGKIPRQLKLSFANFRVTQRKYLDFVTALFNCRLNRIPQIFSRTPTENDLEFCLQSTSLDGGSSIGHQPGPGGPTVVPRNASRRWLSQNSQSSRQHSAEDGVRGGNVGVGGPVSTSSSSQAPGQAAPPALPPRRVSPAADTTEIANAGPISRADR